MTNTTFAASRSFSTSTHSPSLSGEPKLCAATRKSRLCTRLISRSAAFSGDSKLDPTYKIVIFNPCYPWLNDSLQLILEVPTNLSQPIQHVLLNFPVPATIRLQQTLH